ncbi:cell adhesion molecule DSCAML1-like isoform X2 [Cataglyphis hispanica]|uniref:cell adhesion molecule DSCAML1-like isoform X2 n=2 Tax=Cataglyphis hispanica TaxID=1086592 RepID=UPI00217FBA12|nr:cell adhesion molecule DSCAML1-like isoform X2 [Cataglyphis hispanica]
MRSLLHDIFSSMYKCNQQSMQGPTRCTADHRIHEDRASEPLDRGPYFDVSVSRNVTALVGQTATLNCRVRNLGDRTVSWVRHRDIHLLTVGTETYTSDQRFVTLHFPRTEDWTLQVKYPQRRDSGTYECQVSTTPPIGHSMLLSVVEPVTMIIGEPEMYINKDSTMNLTCVVRHSPEPPFTIKWTHNNEAINYDSPRGGVSVITEKGEVTTSYLLIQRAQPADSGQYTCHPSNANTKTVLVHVLNGEHPAAMQHGGQLRLANLPFVMISTTLLTFLNHPY